MFEEPRRPREEDVEPPVSLSDSEKHAKFTSAQSVIRQYLKAPDNHPENEGFNRAVKALYDEVAAIYDKHGRRAILTAEQFSHTVMNAWSIDGPGDWDDDSDPEPNKPLTPGKEFEL